MSEPGAPAVTSPLFCPRCWSEGRIVRLIYVLAPDWYLCECDYVITDDQLSEVVA